MRHLRKTVILISFGINRFVRALSFSHVFLFFNQFQLENPHETTRKIQASKFPTNLPHMRKGIRDVERITKSHSESRCGHLRNAQDQMRVVPEHIQEYGRLASTYAYASNTSRRTTMSTLSQEVAKQVST